MLIQFSSYHALRNDFIVIETGRRRLIRTTMKKLALAICDRRSGVGADGILCLSAPMKEGTPVAVYNADGSRAETSGNGIRIAALHLHRRDRRKKRFDLLMHRQLRRALITDSSLRSALITTDLGKPSFEAKRVPVRSRSKFMINSLLKLDHYSFPVTCLSVGNPHAVLFVDGFDFEWRMIGEEIENHRAFPNRTNVEFVKVVNRRRIEVAEWERGAGATGSSGTGAAAAVCAGVMLGLIERRCTVCFPGGNLAIRWDEDSGLIELAGPAEHIADGSFEYL